MIVAVAIPTLHALNDVIETLSAPRLPPAPISNPVNIVAEQPGHTFMSVVPVAVIINRLDVADGFSNVPEHAFAPMLARFVSNVETAAPPDVTRSCPDALTSAGRLPSGDVIVTGGVTPAFATYAVVKMPRPHSMSSTDIVICFFIFTLFYPLRFEF